MATPEPNYADQLLALVNIQNEQEYFKALGEFIHEWSRLEATAHSLLAVQAGLDRKTAIAVLSGVKASDVPGLLRRLAEARTGKREIDLELEEAFSHMKTLNDARNEIVHHGAHVKAGDRRWVSNRTKALSKAKETLRAVSPTILAQMTSDTRRIQATMFLHAEPKDREELIRDLYDPELGSPWQYKPDEPDHRGPDGQTHKGRQK